MSPPTAADRIGSEFQQRLDDLVEDSAAERPVGRLALQQVAWVPGVLARASNS